MPMLDQRSTNRSIWRYQRALTLIPIIKVMSARSYNPYTAFDSQDTFGTRRSRNLLDLLVFDRALQT
jgi:hypothetical protein